MVRIHSTKQFLDDCSAIANALITTISLNMSRGLKARKMGIESVRMAYFTRVKADLAVLYRFTRKDKWLFAQYVDIIISSVKLDEELGR